MQDYELEGYYRQDSTATSPNPRPAKYPGEEEGLTQAAGYPARKMSPVPFVKEGIPRMAAGLAGDVMTAAGALSGIPGGQGQQTLDLPSFTGDTVELGKTLLGVGGRDQLAPFRGEGGGFNAAMMFSPARAALKSARRNAYRLDPLVVKANKLAGREPVYHGIPKQWDGYQPTLHGLRTQYPDWAAKVQVAPGVGRYPISRGSPAEVTRGFRGVGNEFNTRGLFGTSDLPVARHYSIGNKPTFGNPNAISTEGSVLRTFVNPKNYREYAAPHAQLPKSQQKHFQNLSRQQYKDYIAEHKGVRYPDFEGAGTFGTGKVFDGVTKTKNPVPIRHEYGQSYIMTRGLKNKKWAEVDPITGLRTK